MKKKIYFITGSRAEYGQFSFFLQELNKQKKISLGIIVTGMHLYKKFGYTYKEIVKDKLKILKKIDIKSSEDKVLTVPNSTALGINKFAKFFENNRPDFVCIPCDRFEMLSPAIAAHFLNIPVIHFYGGETSEGSQDNTTRNIISQVATYHFVSHPTCKKKIIQMGKNEKNIFCIGAISLDNIKFLKLIKRNQILEELNIPLSKKKIILVTFHPVTIDSSSTKIELDALLEALNKFKDLFLLIFTMPNNDTGHKYIINRINLFCKNNSNCFFFDSLGQKKYFSLIKISNLVVGNSSSLLYEVPAFEKMSINVGIRQKNRLFGNSVINVQAKKDLIYKAIKKYIIYKKMVYNPFKKSSSIKNALTIIKNIKYKKYVRKNIH
jgi:UDP-hydrolysing UDP-N-acetyl-D-glucosamine 2-epimerase